MLPLKSHQKGQRQSYAYATYTCTTYPSIHNQGYPWSQEVTVILSPSQICMHTLPTLYWHLFSDCMWLPIYATVVMIMDVDHQVGRADYCMLISVDTALKI